MDSGQLIVSVAAKLNDKDHVRWSVDNLIDYLNSGCLEVCRVAPSLNAERVVLTLTKGTRQIIGAESLSLISIDRNVPSGRAVRMIHAAALDAVLPLWHSADSEQVVKEYAWRPQEPKTFWVYPPAADSVLIECTVCKKPNVIRKPASGQPYEPFPLRDEYAEQVKAWMLYQAYMIDTGQGSLSKANNYQSFFYSSLGAPMAREQANKDG